MADLKKCSVAPNGDIITPEGRLSYARDCFAGRKNDNGDMRYPLTMIFPADADLLPLKKKMLEVASGHESNEAKAKGLVKSRFFDPVEKGQDVELFDGWVMIRLNSPTKPGFIYANGKEVPVDRFDEEIYSGRWGRVSVNPYWSGHAANKGVFLGLQNVQLLRHDDPIGGAKPRAGDQFEAVEGAGDSPDDMFDDADTASDDDLDL